MDLTKEPLKDLVKIYNTLNPEKTVKRFASRDIAIKRVKKLMLKKPSKLSIVRTMFAERPGWRREEIMAKTGWDKNNVQVAMNILKNPKRTKVPLTTFYDKRNKSFTLIK